LVFGGETAEALVSGKLKQKFEQKRRTQQPIRRSFITKTESPEPDDTRSLSKERKSPEGSHKLAKARVTFKNQHLMSQYQNFSGSQYNLTGSFNNKTNKRLSEKQAITFLTRVMKDLDLVGQVKTMGYDFKQSRFQTKMKQLGFEAIRLYPTIEEFVEEERQDT